MDATVGTWGRAPAAVWRRTARGVVVMTGVQDEVVLLDGTAEHIWELLEPPTTAHALAGALASRFGAPLPQVLRELAPTLLQLQDAGVVEHQEQAR